MNKIINITSILLVIAFGTAVYLAYTTATEYIAIKKQEVENEAKFQCAASSTYSVTTSETTTVSYPVADLYKVCLQEKGL